MDVARKYDAVLFDWFETLVHHKGNAVKKLIAASGVQKIVHPETGEFIDAQEFATIYPINSLEELVDKYLKPERPLDLHHFQEMLNDDIRNTVPYEDSLPTVKKLRSMGLIVGVISNTNSLLKRSFLESGFHKEVDTYLFSCDPDVQARKNDAKIYDIGILKINEAYKASQRNGNTTVKRAEEPYAPVPRYNIVTGKPINDRNARIIDHPSKLPIPPERILMVGDNYQKDVLGAQLAGMNAKLLIRRAHHSSSQYFTSASEVIPYVSASYSLVR